MRIAIDVVPIRNTGEIGGAFHVVNELIKGLAQHSTKDQYFLLTAEWNHLFFEQFEKYGVHRICIHDVKKNEELIQNGLLYRIIRKVKRLTKKVFPSHRTILKANQIDVLFCPMTDVNMAEPGIPTLSLIHDIQHEYYPQFFSSEELSHRREFYEDVVSVADAVACVSSFTRDTVIDKLNFPADKASVVHNSIQTRFSNTDPQSVEKVLEKHRLKNKIFAYFPANYWPHKNHKMLLVALSMFHAKYPELDFHLCLTGSLLNHEDDFRFAVQQMGLEGKVQHLGYLPEEEISIIMNKAAMLVFPSLFEGFGIPLAEAMSVGTPVACSNNSSLPEVGGDAALYFDPRRPDSIVNSMYRILTDQDVREQLIVNGYKQVEKFNKQKMISDYYAALKNVVKTGSKKRYSMQGIYGDQWSEPTISLTVGEASEERILYLEMMLPPASPNEEGTVTIIVNGKKRKYKLINNQLLIIEQDLPKNSVDVILQFQPIFKPAELGIMDDRELGVQVFQVQIKTKSTHDTIKSLHSTNYPT